MAYRRYRSSRRRGYARSQSNGPHLLDELVDLIIELIAASGRLLAKPLRWLWRRLTHAGQAARATERTNTPTRAAAVHRPAWRRRDRRSRRQRIEETTQHWREMQAAREASELARLPYRPQPHLMSEGKQALWFPLYKAVQGRYRIFCKVRLGDVVCAPAKMPDEWRWFRKIRGYHVDFVICDP